ncbi:glutaredoxin-C1 isoform X1 [Capsella rubella]|uniref:glutaredoxin-C1 isoform X1 n=1 Tax=Capsella rubella TaxID=81985 RepID=UPI000CD564F8|nr:glutaredoxin-C1 isoform X1 [Capsella rubella]
MSKEEIQMAMNKTKEIVSSHPVVVFSKTYCRYCQRVKQLLTQLGASFKVFELDEISHGSEIQSALSEWTGQSTVPSVFIKGKHIGGSDKVMETYKQDKLVPLLTEAGALANIPSKL